VPPRYTALAILLHWLIAALILWNVGLAMTAEDLDASAAAERMQLHKSVGITVLILSLVRLGWRLAHPPPPYPGTLHRWERRLATALHRTFYVLMIGLPLLGWTIVSASLRNIPTVLYGTLPWPRLPILGTLPIETRRVVTATAADVHVALAWLTVALIVLHVGAALKHQLVDRNQVLYRMAPMRFLQRR
jgi:cytochrome b561